MRDPELAIGDGALGFWAALRDVWPETREQRDWVHRIANVLDKLPKRLQPKAKAALHEIMKSESREAAQEEIRSFREEYGAKFPKAVEALSGSQEKLLTFFDFPDEHWLHIRTSSSPVHAKRAAPPDRVGLLDGAAQAAGDEGRGFQAKGIDHGLQTPGDGPAALATAQRLRAAPVGQGRGTVQGRSSSGTRRSNEGSVSRGDRRRATSVWIQAIAPAAVCALPGRQRTPRQSPVSAGKGTSG
jgi:hypothetical protein